MAIFSPHQPAWLRSKYLWVLVIAFVWMAFLDKYSLLSQWRMRQNISRIKEDITSYKQGILDLDYEIEKMTTDRREIEKFAREQYWMKKKNEDLFIITEE
jgi:cell division protein FtsB